MSLKEYAGRSSTTQALDTSFVTCRKPNLRGSKGWCRAYSEDIVLGSGDATLSLMTVYSRMALSHVLLGFLVDESVSA